MTTQILAMRTLQLLLLLATLGHAGCGDAVAPDPGSGPSPEPGATLSGLEAAQLFPAR